MSHNYSARSLLAGKVQGLGWRTEFPSAWPPSCPVAFWFCTPVITCMRAFAVPQAPPPAKDVINSCQAFFATGDLQNGFLFLSYH